MVVGAVTKHARRGTARVRLADVPDRDELASLLAGAPTSHHATRTRSTTSGGFIEAKKKYVYFIIRSVIGGVRGAFVETDELTRVA